MTYTRTRKLEDSSILTSYTFSLCYTNATLKKLDLYVSPKTFAQ
jgi:hypothetical protein